MKRRFIIYLSIFLSIFWMIGHRSSTHPVTKTVGRMTPKNDHSWLFKLEVPITAAYIYDPHEPIIHEASRSAPIVIPPSTTTTTTKVVSVVPKIAAPVERVAISSSSSCLYRKMSISQAHICWDGLIDQYPWNHYEAFHILYCESTGKSNAKNGIHIGLMQETYGSTDPATNIHDAYYKFYLARGRSWGAWACR